MVNLASEVANASLSSLPLPAVFCLFVYQVVFDSFSTPLTIARQAPLSEEFSKQEYWCGLPFPSPGDPPWLRDRTCSSCCISCISGKLFTTEPPGMPMNYLQIKNYPFSSPTESSPPQQKMFIKTKLKCIHTISHYTVIEIKLHTVPYK